MKYKYEINDKNEIRIWDTENPNELNAPFFLQPDYPDGSPWANKLDATAWAELFIESLVNPESEFLPGDSPDEPKKLRPKPAEEN